MITGTLCLCDDFVTSLQDVLRRLKIGAGIQRPWCVMHPDMPLAEPRVGVGPGRLKVTRDPQGEDQRQHKDECAAAEDRQGRQPMSHPRTGCIFGEW